MNPNDLQPLSNPIDPSTGLPYEQQSSPQQTYQQPATKQSVTPQQVPDTYQQPMAQGAITPQMVNNPYQQAIPPQPVVPQPASDPYQPQNQMLTGSQNVPGEQPGYSNYANSTPLQQPPSGGKSWLVTLILSVLLGFFGIDRFYLGKTKTALLKLITLGGLGIWSLIDWVNLLRGTVTDGQGNPLVGRERNFKVGIIILVVLLLVDCTVGYFAIAGLSNNGYNSATQTAYVKACESAGGSASLCGCGYNILKEEYSYKEFKSLENNFNSPQSSPQYKNYIDKIETKCLGSTSTTGSNTTGSNTSNSSSGSNTGSFTGSSTGSSITGGSTTQ